ncbi:MAG: nucleotidyltransferase domain-containing protein [Acetobacteraceae bacterium]|nr:nucleotidyltransferase domain-containing protein [Acetobacteraceae bacterium]
MHRAVPASLVAQIVATYSPLRVILFGSQARGEAGPDSDIDLLVILDDDAPPEALHWRRRYEARRGHDGAVDIIPCRQSILHDRARAPGSLAAAALREGVTIYERP